MKSLKLHVSKAKDSDRIGKFALLFLSGLIILYGFFDITTSQQTYHVNYDRTASKIFLLLIIAFSLFYCLMCLISQKYRSKDFFNYFFSDNFAIFIISIVCLAVSELISYFINKFAFSALVTTVIPYVVFVSLSTFMKFWSFENSPRQKTMLCSTLTIFFFYYFFILFYFFYIQGRPTSSGGLRVPVLSHIFFPLSLIPSLRILLKQKIAYIYLLFFPLVIIADKTSVLIVFAIYVASDLFNSTLFAAYQKHIKIIAWCFAAAVAFILIFANFTPQQSFLYRKLSFNAIILSSGRIQNWTNIIKDIKNFSVKNVLFGKGASATTFVNFGTAAHNDFLESFYDFGLLGLASMISFASYFLVNAIKIQNDSRHNLLLACYVCFFMLISAIFSNGNILLCFSFSATSMIKQRIYYDKTGTSIYRDGLRWELHI